MTGRRLGLAATGVLVLAASCYAFWRFVLRDPDNLDAKQIIDDTLKSPGTAKYISTTILAKRHHYRLARVVVDMQNGFGVYVRGKFCFAWHVENHIVYWNPEAIVENCPEIPDESLLAEIQRNADWPAY